MEIYLVGGAVRDSLLGLAIKEKDWVVVGASPEELLARGFLPVGKDFPVFLHPKTHEEYALARTERKIAKGYKGFSFYADKAVTLIEDLKRRDITINAMALSTENKLIDPYAGQKDLANRILRHVSPAFVEDPVRILRVARLAAKLADFNFTVAAETNELMQTMVQNGEINALVAERVWQEFERALKEKNPLPFFKVLNDCGALTVLFPEINLSGRGMKAFALTVEKNAAAVLRFAALYHDLPTEKLKSFVTRLRVPNEYSDLALLIAKNYSQYCRLETAEAQDIYQLLKLTDAFRRKERFQQFIAICDICLQVTTQQSLSFADKLNNALQAANTVEIQTLISQGFQGQALADELKRLQIIAIEKIIK